MPGGTRSRILKLRRLTQAGRARKDSPAWSSLRWLRWNASASTTPSVTLKKVPAGRSSVSQRVPRTVAAP